MIGKSVSSGVPRSSSFVQDVLEQPEPAILGQLLTPTNSFAFSFSSLVLLNLFATHSFVLLPDYHAYLAIRQRHMARR